MPPKTKAGVNCPTCPFSEVSLKLISPSDTPRSLTHIDDLQLPQVFDTVQSAVAAGQEVVQVLVQTHVLQPGGDGAAAVTAQSFHLQDNHTVTNVLFNIFNSPAFTVQISKITDLLSTKMYFKYQK